MNKVIVYLWIGLLVGSCKPKKQGDTLFTVLDKETTGITFTNTIEQSFSFNFLNYQYIYNGGGVAIGDLNNDGREDLYFTANQGSNKLYLNQGDFRFEDVTETAGLSDEEGWTTGVTLVDINSDGLLDIYVCKSGSVKNKGLRRNKLFINQSDGRFQESAREWGLDKTSFSTQSYFFDYDRDGDLDAYLVNHRPDFNRTRQITGRQGIPYFPERSDNLLRNDEGVFTDVTVVAGMVNHSWGLSASIGDFNQDGWPDVYVANDYIQPDLLYINNQDGTFTDKARSMFGHISYNSMGSDYADVNNDHLPDLMVLDMLADDHIRSKENMATMSTQGFWAMVRAGYHHSYMSNTLHLNNGNGTFKEVAQLAGVARTDWSWAPLVADFDLDGYQDLFVTNGIQRDLTNQDYRQKLQEIIQNRVNMPIEQVEALMPTNQLANYLFKNQKGLSFEKVTEAWGMDLPINSNGASYGDLDGDGDLDLVVNNQATEALVFKNNAAGNYLKVSLQGDTTNPGAFGAEVHLFAPSGSQYRQLFPARGYQSSVSPVLHFGLGEDKLIDSLIVVWTDRTVSSLKSLPANQTLDIMKDSSAVSEELAPMPYAAKKPEVTLTNLIEGYRHQRNEVDDYAYQTLLPQKQSVEGPPMAVADINGDGLDDLFVGNGPGSEGELYVQGKGKTFRKVLCLALSQDQGFDDWGAAFFDADNDGDPDLYVASGSYARGTEDALLQDRLYLNKGDLLFERSRALPDLPFATKAVASLDIDGDDDQDLVVAGHIVPEKYPLAPGTFLLENDGGEFKNVTNELAPELLGTGMVNELAVADLNGDQKDDLIIVGEWMPVTLFIHESGRLKQLNDPVLAQSSGWWQTVQPTDVDGDGDPDLLLGNFGENNKFHPTAEKPLHVYATHFDDNETFDVVLSKEYRGSLVPVRGKECSTEQNPFVSEKIPTYREFAASDMEDIYGQDALSDAQHFELHTLSSMVLYNEGAQGWRLAPLPAFAQVGPTLGLGLIDVNGDGIQDVIGVGGEMDAEVETIRYDGNTGYLLLADRNGGFTNYAGDLKITPYAKSMRPIVIDGTPGFVIGSYAGGLTFVTP